MRFVGIGIESSYATRKTPDKFYDFVGHSVSLEQELLLHESIAHRAPPLGVAGSRRVSGDFEGILDSLNCLRLMYLLLGSCDTTPDEAGSPTAYKHELTPSNELPSFTLELNHDYTKSRFLVGCGLNRIEIRANAGELVTFTAEVTGSNEEVDSASSPSTVTVGTPFVFHKAALKKNGTTLALVKTFSLRIENNIADDVFVLGQQGLAKLIPQALTIEGELELVFEDESMYNTFLNASDFELELELTGGSTGSTVSGFETEKLVITLPKVMLSEGTWQFSRREMVEYTFRLRGLHDKSSGYAIKATIINTEAEP